MGINETIADTRHWITEHKLKAIGQSLFSFARNHLYCFKTHIVLCYRWPLGNRSSRVTSFSVVEANSYPAQNYTFQSVCSGDVSNFPCCMCAELDLLAGMLRLADCRLSLSVLLE